MSMSPQPPNAMPTHDSGKRMKMRELRPEEVTAMWLYGAEYARSGLSAVDWYKRLSMSHQMVVVNFVNEMRQAFDRYDNLSPISGRERR